MRNGSEFHRRCRLRSGLSLEIGALFEAEQSGQDVLGEAADGGIELAGRVIEVLACHVDAVLRTFQLGLQFQEVLVGLQVGIVLGDGQQFAQSRGQLSLCGLVFGQLLRCQVGGVYFDLLALLRASMTPSSVSCSWAA